MTLIEHGLYQQMTKKPKLYTSNPGLAAANGSTIQVTGTGIFNFSLGKSNFLHHAIVVKGLHVPCIIGADFMTEHKIEIDMGRKKIRMNDPRSDHKPLTLRSAKRFCIEPFSEKIISACLNYSCAGPSELLINQQTDPLTIEEGITTILNGHCQFPVRNLTAESIYVCRNDPIGFAVPLPTNCMLHVDAIKQQRPLPFASTVNSFKDEISLKLRNIIAPMQRKYCELLSSFTDVFSINPDDVGRCSSLPQDIRLKDPNSVSCTPPYRIPHILLPVAHDYVNKLLARDIIRPSTSPFSSPLMLVKKPGILDPTRPMVEQYRLVHDYRRLNSLTIRDSYPLRNLFELIDEVGQGKIFTVIDLSQGFWNQELTERSKPYTAFGVPGLGHFEYNRSAQGLCNSPPAFQRLLDHVTRGLKGTYVYLDDVVLVAKTHEEHLSQLAAVLQRFRDYGIKCRLSKLQLATAEINYLGYNISAHDGIRPGKLKTDAIRNWMPPTDQRQVKQFLGLCSFFRRTIKDYAHLAAPLTKLTRQNSTWTNGPLPSPALAAFRMLQAKLMTRPCLKPVDFAREFILTVDTSKEAIGAILSQKDSSGIEHPCAYASRTLTETESKYSPTHLESFGLLWGARHFRPYLAGKHFTIRTDHKPLTSLNRTSGQALERIHAELQEFLPYTVEYLAGDEMPADGLSRPTKISEISSPSSSDWISLTHQQLHDLQKTDKYIKALVCHIKFGLESSATPLRNFVRSLRHEVIIQNGIVGILKNGAFAALAPYHLQPTLFQLAHDLTLAGHLGPEKTFKRLQQDWYWPKMREDVYNYCRSCHECLKSNYPSNKKPSPLEPMPEVSRFNQRIHLDLLGPLPRSEGNQYILAMSDAFTSWIELIGIPDKQTSTVARAFLNQWISNHALPEKIHSDMGKEFDSKIFKEMSEKLNISHTLSSAGHSRSNGQVEAVNRSIINYIRKFVSSNEHWNELLPSLKLALNTAPHTTKKYSPFFSTYARRPNLATMLACPTRNYSDEEISQRLTNLTNITRNVMDNQKLAFERQKIEFDKKSRERNFEPGDIVYVTRPHSGKLFQKFQPLFDGPYTVVERKGHNNYKLLHETRKKIITVHIDRLKMATIREQLFSEMDPSPMPEQQEAEDDKAFVEFERALEQARFLDTKGELEEPVIAEPEMPQPPPPPSPPPSPPPFIPPHVELPAPARPPQPGGLPGIPPGIVRQRVDTYPGGFPDQPRKMPKWRGGAEGGAKRKLPKPAEPGRKINTRQRTKEEGIVLPEARDVPLPGLRDKKRKRLDSD